MVISFCCMYPEPSGRERGGGHATRHQGAGFACYEPKRAGEGFGPLRPARPHKPTQERRFAERVYFRFFRLRFEPSCRACLRTPPSLVCFAFHAQLARSLELTDPLSRHSQVNAKGWGLGQANGKVGWFPGDFVDMRPSAVERKSRWVPACAVVLVRYVGDVRRL